MLTTGIARSRAMDLTKWLGASSWRGVKIYRYDTMGMLGWYSVVLSWKPPGADIDTPWDYAAGDHKDLSKALAIAYSDPFSGVPQDG